MAVYIVTGKLGSGKTLSMVGRIHDALLKGQRVATNLNIFPEKFLPPWHRKGELWRVPDKPLAAELEALGPGNHAGDPNEDNFGHLVLDECGTWLNARTWNDQERAKLIDWLLHARKHCWHVYLLIQNVSMLDKQVRDSLAEFVVVCRRTDRFKIPGVPIRLPKAHIGFVRYGVNVNDPVVERWFYRARNYYQAYDTRQVFKDRNLPGAITETRRVPLPGELDQDAARPSLLRRLFLPIKAAQAKAAALPQAGPTTARAKHPLVELLMRFPADLRITEFARLQRLGCL